MLNLMKKNNVGDRCKTFFDICDVENDAWIDETKLLRLMKKLFYGKEASLSCMVDFKHNVHDIIFDFFESIKT